MATLEKIRNKAGLLVTVVGVALFAFIIGDGLRSGSTFFRQSKETVLNVDGKSIKIHEYMNSVDELTEIYSMQMGGGNLTEDQQSQVRNEVYERYVREILINEEASKVGFTVTSDEIYDMVLGDNISPMVQQMPMFQNEAGHFDKTVAKRFLDVIIKDMDYSQMSPQEQSQIENSKKFWLYLEKEMRQRKMEEKYGALLAKAVVANSLDAKDEYEENKVSVDFEYTVKNYATLPDTMFSVSESEIKNLYNKRKELYKQEPAAEIKFIVVNVTPSDEDYAEVKKAMSDLKEEFITSTDIAEVVNENSDKPFYDAYTSASLLSADAKRFVTEAQIGDVQGPVQIGNTFHMYKYLGKMIAPDSIRVNELTLPMYAENELKVFSDSLINVIKGGQSFAELAQSLTGGRYNGDMGWLTDETALRRIDESFRNAIFDAKINDVFVLKTTRGTHLMQVTEKTAPVEKYKVADIAMEVDPSTRTVNQAQTLLSQYILKNNTWDKFEAEAPAAGYICQSASVEKNDQTLQGMPSTRQVVRWAFESKKGEMSKVFEDNNRFLVAIAGDHLAKGFRPVAAVSEILKRELINDKKAEKIMADLKAKNCTSLEECGDRVDSVKFVNFNTRSIAGIGMEPALNAAAPIAEINKISGPVKGKNGVYMFKVLVRHDNPGEFNPTEQKQMMGMQNAYRYMYQSMQMLRDKAEIDDNRITFY